MDESRVDTEDSPEIRRGGSNFSDNALIKLESLSLSNPWTPDIKNSTIMPNAGARNISDISHFHCSPIDPVCFSPSILSTSDFSTEMSRMSHSNAIGFPSFSPRLPRHNCRGLKDLEEMNSKSETAELSHAGRSSSEQWTTNVSKILPQQTQVKSVGAISPGSQREHAREFMRCHHSCISSPPMHWKRTPIANELPSKFGRKAASKSIVADYSISFGEFNGQEESSPILTPKYIVTDMTTTQLGNKPTGANSETGDQSSKACHPLETSPKSQASNGSEAATAAPDNETESEVTCNPAQETREEIQKLLQASKYPA